MYQAVPSVSSSSSPAHRGMHRAAVTANCSFSSSPCSHLSPHLVFLHQSCFKHGRVNLRILQAASLPIYLSSCFPSLCSSQTGLCCQAPPERWGCHEWWMTINLLLSSTTLLGDLQARWLPGMKTNLSFSFLPSILHPYLPCSLNLASSISTSPLFLHFHNGEMCAEQ